MSISIFTTITDPTRRGDLLKPAFECYKDLADELVVVDGSVNAQPTYFKTVKNYARHWPKEFEWPFIGRQFQRGYEICTKEWVIHMDIDFIFHEDSFDHIREALLANSDAPAVSFYKHQFILPDRYNIKSRLVIAVNKARYGDRIRFDSGGDGCQPSLDGKYISPKDVPEAGIAFFNYEKILKTKAQIADDQGRMERAYKRHFGHTQMGSDGTDEDAYRVWLKAQRGKLNRPQKHIDLYQHPKYMQETIRNLKPEQWGYNGFGIIEGRVYAQGM